MSPLQTKDLHSRHAGVENREIVSRHERRITPMSNCQLGQIPGGRNETIESFWCVTGVLDVGNACQYRGWLV